MSESEGDFQPYGVGGGAETGNEGQSPQGFNPDPKQILFQGRAKDWRPGLGKEGEPDLAKYGQIVEAEKNMYKAELSSSVLGSLSHAFPEGSKLRGIYEEINEIKQNNPDSSLFAVIQAKLGMLAEEPEHFEVKGQTLSEDERERAADGLKSARHILAQTAKVAGVFEPLNNEIDRIQEETIDFEEAIRSVEFLKGKPRRLAEREATMLEKSSPDFGGISTDYINGALLNMEYALEEASYDHLKAKAEAAVKAGRPQAEVDELLLEAQQHKEDSEDLKKSLDFLGWGKPRPGLITKAREYLIKKESGRLQEELDQGKKGEGITEGRPTEDTEGSEVMRGIRSGYDGLIHAIRIRARVDPETFDRSLISEGYFAPLWFENLTPEYQGMVRSLLHVNWIAAVKKATGAQGYDEWARLQGVEIRREDLKNMWDKMPGFKAAMATLVNDIFEKDNDHFRIIEGGGRKGIKGYDLLLNKTDFDKYKERKVDQLAKQLKGKPEAIDWAMKHFGHELRHAEVLAAKGDERGQKIVDKVFRKIATVSVYAADNLLFATGAYDSANEFKDGFFDSVDRPSGGHKFRKINVSSHAGDGIRAFFMPGQKWVDLAGQGRVFGGPLGDWMQDNYNHNRKDANYHGGARGKFGDLAKKGKIGYIPKRLFYSLLEFMEVETRDEQGRETGKTVSIAQLLLKGRTEVLAKDKTTKKIVDENTNEETEVPVEEVLLDYELNNRGLIQQDNEYDITAYNRNDYKGKAEKNAAADWNGIRVDELWGDYHDTGEAARKIHKHLTASNPNEGRLTAIELTNALVKVRQKPVVKRLYDDRDFMKAAIGMAISPEKGFKKGTTELLLDIDKGLYQVLVNDYLSDDRLYQWEGGQIKRSELLKAYHSGDEHKLLDVIFDIHFGQIFLAHRERLSRKARKKRQKELEQQEWGLRIDNIRSKFGALKSS